MGDLAAGGEVEVELVGGSEVAAARHRRLHDAARDGDRALLGGRRRGRADDHDGDDDRGDRQRSEDDRHGGRSAQRAATHQLLLVSLGGCPFPRRKSGTCTPSFFRHA
jgi:hypothetical protein